MISSISDYELEAIRTANSIVCEDDRQLYTSAQRSILVNWSSFQRQNYLPMLRYRSEMDPDGRLRNLMFTAT